MKGPKILDDLSFSSVHQNLCHQGAEEDFFSPTPNNFFAAGFEKIYNITANIIKNNFCVPFHFRLFD